MQKANGFNSNRERMVLPLWRSLHSVNLMLPKEERRAMLLRIYNEDSNLVNTTQKRQGAVDSPASATPVAEGEEGAEPAGVAAATEEQVLQEENVVLGQDQQDQMEQRETWTKAGDEEDRFNTTV